jgi:hypothetical protein
MALWPVEMRRSGEAKETRRKFTSFGKDSTFPLDSKV